MTTITVYNTYAVAEAERMRFTGEIAFMVSGSLLNAGYIGVDLNGAPNAVAIFGDGSFQNHGVLHVQGGASAQGVVFSGGVIENSGDIQVRATSWCEGVVVGGDAVLNNSGRIVAGGGGYGFGVHLLGSSSAADAPVVDNTGLIRGMIAVIGDTTGAASPTFGSFHNGGHVIGDVVSGSMALHIVNDGLIEGRVSLGQMDDSFDGRHGRVETFGSNIGQISGGLGADTLTGGGRTDVLYGDQGNGAASGGGDLLSGGRGDDHLYGEAGADTLAGGRGIDELTGGDGVDVFVFSLSDMFVAGSGPDLINDLHAEDVIDLSAIDADVHRHGNQHFVLVDQLTAHAGQAILAYDATQDWTTLTLDNNGDGWADGQVVMRGDQTGHTAFVW